MIQALIRSESLEGGAILKALVILSGGRDARSRKPLSSLCGFYRIIESKRVNISIKREIFFDLSEEKGAEGAKNERRIHSIYL